MESRIDTLDWSLIRTFLAVADTGSLSAAARRLGISQPTIGRQVRQIEDALDLTLFTRQPRGLHLTDSGAALLPHARRMAEAMNALALTAAGRTEDLRGTVRLTASAVVAHHILPPIIAQIRQAEPLIQIELVASDSSDNLLFREADIAVRMYRSTQLDIVTRHLGNLRLGVFAARTYLDRRGWPQQPTDLLGHDLIGYDRNELILHHMRAMGWPATREMFAIRCDSQTAYLALIRAGCGIGFAQAGLMQDRADLVELDLGLDLPHLPVWLAAPQAMRGSPRIARVWDLLAEGLTPVLSRP
ncbi:LysR family transcriptional regulator [Seohaeicola sp. SP36]|jgi:DNA-binding transcriptional LysR family regulator|uniref:LysR family transcriptional regulator n=1 Tax=unclassified Seohaeicola TaxID=2641111 RepID=UPI00237BE5AB|nr:MULTISPECIES: LysR family transcriptional regulator [unclassified Seohaeicola]MDD9706704.1 LysR family transcriptional regulator [Seohaeicola sp. 4SK31]MDD9734410.1 LysR family transcriptional regulator [Seohaeicola sp. SP36]